MLQGVYTALITPFKNNSEEIDYVALKNLLKAQVNSGVAGVVPSGTTGESPTLSYEENQRLISYVVEQAKNLNANCTVIAGTGSNSTKEAIALTRIAAKEGADYALVVSPYYNKPPQSGLVEHFTRIADASDIPLLLYNIPSRTSVSLSLDTIITLSKHQNICGIKEATVNIGFASQIIESTSNDFILLSGDDNLTLPLLSLGGKGVISVLSNVYPDLVSSLTTAFLKNNLLEAQKIHFQLTSLFQKVFIQTNPIPIKFIASLKQICLNQLRLPLVSLNKEDEEVVKYAIEEFEKEYYSK